jgi:hypothetical protein
MLACGLHDHFERELRSSILTGEYQRRAAVCMHLTALHLYSNLPSRAFAGANKESSPKSSVSGDSSGTGISFILATRFLNPDHEA